MAAPLVSKRQPLRVKKIEARLSVFVVPPLGGWSCSPPEGGTTYLFLRPKPRRQIRFRLLRFPCFHRLSRRRRIRFCEQIRINLLQTLARLLRRLRLSVFLHDALQQ